MKRIFALLMCFAMLISICPVSAFAAGGATNVYAEYRAGASGSTVLDPNTALNPGDSFRIRINCREMTISSFACGIFFDTGMFEVTKISSPTLSWWGTKFVMNEETEEEEEKTDWWPKDPTSVSSLDEANRDGRVGVVFAGTTDLLHKNKLIFTITLKVKDNATGSSTISFFEDSAGTDGYKSDSVASQTITIAGAEVACTHEKTTTTTVDATCTTDGSTTVTCDTCGETISTTVIPAGHSYGDLIPAKEAVHTQDKLEPAVAAHYHCVCGKYFTEDKVETTLASLTGATPTHTPNADATCGTAQTCTVCGKVLSTATGSHTYDNACDASCNVCGATRTPADHVYDNACDTSCNACGATREVEGHKYDNACDADCNVCGATRTPADHVYDNACDASCNVCGAAREVDHAYGDLIPAKAEVHEEDKLEPAVAAHYFCDACDTYFDAEKNATTLAALTGETPKHTVDPTKTTENVTENPTCTEEGTKEIATFCTCGYAFEPTTESIPVDPVAHSWGTPSYSWTSDYSACTATRVCAHNEKHTETAEAKVTSQKITDETCSAAGETKYTATFEESWATTQTEIDDVPGATGNHTFNLDTTKGDNGYEWAADYSTCTAHGVCSCGKTTSVTVDTSSVTTPGTCQTAEVVTYTADFSETWTVDQNKAVTGAVNSNNHAGDRIASYHDHDSHNITCSSCSDVIVANEDHSFENGSCTCGAIPVQFQGDLSFVLGAEADKDFVYEFAAEVTTEYALQVVAIPVNSENPMSDAIMLYVPKGETGTLKIPSISESYIVDVLFSYTGRLNLNGGTLDPETKAMYESFGFAVTAEYVEIGFPVGKEVWLVNSQFSREGYTLTGFKYDGVTYTFEEAITVSGHDFAIDLVWTSNHTCSAKTYQDLKDGTHQAYCECGEKVGEPEVHNFQNDQHRCVCEVYETFDITIDLNGGVIDEEVKGALIEQGCTVTDQQIIAYDYAYNEDIEFSIDGLTKTGHTMNGVTDQDGNYYADGKFNITKDVTLTVNWKPIEYTLTVRYIAVENGLGVWKDAELQVAYGAKLLEAIAAAKLEGMLEVGTVVRVNNENDNGEYKIHGFYYTYEETTMPAEDHYVEQSFISYGWTFFNGDTVYHGADGWVEAGWNFIEEDYDDVEGGAWYYFEGNESLGLATRVEGVTRVPYPTEAINGVTYAPNAVDAAYEGENFADKDTALFLFGTDGKFQSTFTGIVPSEDSLSPYAVNGMLPWHVGLVQVGEDYYYFCGNENVGGNIAYTGDVYISRNTTGRDVVIGGVYTFDATGKLVENNGIVDMTDGTKRYYQDARLMIGNGLTQVGENYIYVRSNGELVVNAEYWVADDNGLNIVTGMCKFDENGFMVNPVATSKDGVYFENNAWYYYENGVIGYNKGLIEVTENWVNGEAVESLTGVIYVRSNGQLATGDYYVTTLGNYTGTGVNVGDKLTFGTNGLMASSKNGIVAENDGLYYYENNNIAFNKGVIEIDGKYYYVRSNGKVVNNCSYWISNVGESNVVAKEYMFDENGAFTPVFKSELKNGIVDGYYYVDGNLQYAAGVIKLDDGAYIYVKSNGQLATGKYWPTNNNGLLNPGIYDFGTDGKLYF